MAADRQPRESRPQHAGQQTASPHREVKLRMVSHKDRDGKRAARVAALLAEALKRTFERLD